MKTIMAVAAVGLLGGALSACVSTRGPGHHGPAAVVVHDSGHDHARGSMDHHRGSMDHRHGPSTSRHRGPSMSSHKGGHVSSHRTKRDDHRRDHKPGDHH
jgi:hypothetical protein